ncbi:MAG TPA: Fic family protein [Candidatus Rifleibacterium sp.]|nr:Fic family protein [Candidatus Rifleibacterium sp.]
MTAAMISLIAAVSEAVGRLEAGGNASLLRLRRINRIRTVQGSLAIEGNTLSIEQITAIIEGKRVIAPPREILEVRNAVKIYEMLDRLRPESSSDLLLAHKVLMSGLAEDAGAFRKKGVGVMAGERVVHMAPPAQRVPGLVNELLAWLQGTDQHPLISSSVFHYEFEFIHPFSDGNGRMGRLWQTLILCRQQALYSAIPVESMIYERQQQYYDALQKSTANSDSSHFIEFMLETILETIRATLRANLTPEVTPDVAPEVKKMLAMLNGAGNAMSRREMQQQLDLSDEKHFREFYLQPAVAGGLIEMTVPQRPTSRLQKYRLTRKGSQLLTAEG